MIIKQERKDQQEKIKELTEKLNDGIKKLFESDKYKDYLRAMAKFHNYSFNNSVLIWAQRPDASCVAGYKGWQTKFGRVVNPGSKGIMIIEPAPYTKRISEACTDENGNPIKDQDGNTLMHTVEHTYQNFKVGYVFAYEDTSGKPLPSIVSILDKDVSNFDSVINALKNISPVPIKFGSVDGGANGYYDLIKREIVVKETLPQAQKIKTAVHEISHAILHDKEIGLDQGANKQEMEVSAESVAYVVCSFLRLDTSNYSFGYIGGWSAGKELKELQKKMELIRSTANTIITGIEAEILKNTQTQQEKSSPSVSQRWR